MPLPSEERAVAKLGEKWLRDSPKFEPSHEIVRFSGLENETLQLSPVSSYRYECKVQPGTEYTYNLEKSD